MEWRLLRARLGMRLDSRVDETFFPRDRRPVKDGRDASQGVEEDGVKIYVCMYVDISEAREGMFVSAKGSITLPRLFARYMHGIPLCPKETCLSSPLLLLLLLRLRSSMGIFPQGSAILF